MSSRDSGLITQPTLGKAARIPNRLVNRMARRFPEYMPGGRSHLARRRGPERAARLLEAIAGGCTPAMVSRLGTTELALMRRASWLPRFGPGHRYDASILGGVFPPTRDVLAEVGRRYVRDLAEVDVLGVWFNWGEASMVNRHAPSAELVPLSSLDPVSSDADRIWIAGLEGRRVVVVHPFADSIRRQYERRHALFREPMTLPDFDLRTVTAVQTAAGGETEHRDWFSALASMEELMLQDDSEVALIGAGAYGLPLAASAKRAGLVALHLGGALQLMFGIIGRRWEGREDLARISTPNWVRPSNRERPARAHEHEGGSYW